MKRDTAFVKISAQSTFK